MAMRPLFLAAGLLAFGSTSLGLMMVHSRGTWPGSWPEELEPLRDRSVSYDVAAGNQEMVHEIPFTSRAEFERLWPAILKVKDEGGKLTLVSAAPNDRKRNFFKTSMPAVRIATPSGGSMKFAGSDESISLGPPWPEDVYDENGHLPEYVAWDGEQWARVTSTRGVRGFIHRARIDITLVVDGRVIDLNRIPLPKDTIIADHRTPPASQPAEEDVTASAPADEDEEELLEPHFPDASGITRPLSDLQPVE